MIRCIPVDGSEPFEVEPRAVLDHAYPEGQIMRMCAASILDENRHRMTWQTVDGRNVHLESWRQCAERLERELDIVRLARDWSEAQHSFEHGDPGAMTDIGAIEAELKTLGVTREEAM